MPAAVDFAMHWSNIWSDYSYIEIHVMNCIGKGVIAGPIPDKLTKIYELWKSWLYQKDLSKYTAFKMSFISRWPIWFNMAVFPSSDLKYTPHCFICTEQVAGSLACDISSAILNKSNCHSVLIRETLLPRYCYFHVLTLKIQCEGHG